MRYIVSYFSTIGHPRSFSIDGKIENGEIHLSGIYEEEILKQDQTVSVYEIKEDHNFRELLEDHSLLCKVKSTDPFILHVLDDKKFDTEVSLMDLVQRKVPRANTYMKLFNKDLATEILSTLDNFELITAVGGSVLITSSQDLILKRENEILKIDIGGIKHLDHHLNYTSYGLLSGSYDHNSYQLEVFFQKDIEDKDGLTFNIVPLKLQYSSKTNLETHSFETNISFLHVAKTQMIKKSTYWFKVTRSPQFLITLLSILVGISLDSSLFNVEQHLVIALIIIGTFLIQSGGNLLNDYFDHISESDEVNISFSEQRDSTKFIQLHLLHPNIALTFGIALFLTGAMIGLYLNYISSGQTILILGTIGGLITYFYTGEPLKLAYRGIGELILAITFGPLIIVGTYFVLSDEFIDLSQLLFITVPSMLLISGLFILNSVKDIEADIIVKKKTTAVRLGRNQSFLFAFALMTISLIISIVGSLFEIFTIGPIDYIFMLMVVIAGIYSTLINKDHPKVLEIYSMTYLFWSLTFLI